MTLYRTISVLLLPMLALAAMIRVWRGSDSWADLRQRLRGPRPRARVIWLHGASLGELQSAKPIIAGLAPDPVLVTANTTTARDMVRGWDMPHVTATLAPLDSRWATRPVMRQARALVTLENEWWPNRIDLARRMGVPIVVIGARMSERTARGWARLGGLSKAMFGAVAHVIPQNAATARRLAERGVPAERISPPLMLKAAFTPDTRPLPQDIVDWAGDSAVLAAATHPGEDEIVIRAFQHARETRPDLRLIIAPRHPERGTAIAALIHEAGLTLAQRSACEGPGGTVYLADTLGEMGLWYRVAGVAFVGGSLSDHGGHTPFEPVAYGCPILHGPHVGNFAESYATLHAALAATRVTAQSLADAMLTHLHDQAMADRARAALPPADPDRVTALIRSVL